jgi:hypothetical protein
MIKDQLRRILQAKAEGFSLPPRLREGSLRKARLRRARDAVGGATAVAIALVFAVLLTNGGTPPAGAFAVFRVQAKPARNHHAAPSHGHDATGPAITMRKLRRHAECMRAHGINVADPVRTAGGWMIPVRQPPVDLGSTVSRRAFFVECRLLDVSDNLVLGGRTRAEIDKLIACTRARGFELPEPTQDEAGQFTFDLSKASPRWGSTAWYETVFVTCAPARDVR